MTTLSVAERLLHRLGVSQPADIDLEAIARLMGALVRYRRLDSCEARIVGMDGRAIISVSSSSSPRRQRFSIGHELGHWHHHRRKLLMCSAADIGQPRHSELHPERVADRFAANLLMPRFLLLPAARSYPKLTLKAVRDIADAFETSFTAAAIRLVEAGPFPSMLICHAPGGRRWFARSPHVFERWFPRDELDTESHAFDVLHGKAREDAYPRRIGADAWFDRHEASRFEVFEQSASLKGEVMTLLTFPDTDMLSDWSGRAARAGRTDFER